MEIDLLIAYPKTKRDLDARLETKTEENRAIARQFGKEFFDGTRDTGYGGFSYNPRFWREATCHIAYFYQLNPVARVLDVGCAKGFMMYDFLQNYPSLSVDGIDISQYAKDNALPEVKDNITVGCASDLSSIPDKYYDLVVSINTVHNLALQQCKQAIREIERVGKNKYIVVDAWRNAEEKKRMQAWNLTAQTMMSVEEWRLLFEEVGYTGDYYWFIP